MIKAVIFDLDGTLVQTERLKAVSYAKAAVELCPEQITEDVVVEAYKEVVGRSRQEVALVLIDRFDLGAAASKRMRVFGVQTVWQAFVQVRLGYYRAMIENPETLREYRWPHNLAILKTVRNLGCLTALATMSGCQQAQMILTVLELQEAFSFIAARDDVEHGKPDPEIYLLSASQLGVAPRSCLVIEDSPAGVQAALAANMHCVAVSTPFTRKQLHAGGFLEERWIVDDPSRLPIVVGHLLNRTVDHAVDPDG